MVVFFLGPLAGLLLLERPASRREWLWVATIGVWAIFWLFDQGGIADQALRTVGVLFTGGFVAMAATGRGTAMTQALWAAAAAVLGTAVLSMALGMSWSQLELAFSHKGWASYRALAAQFALTAPASPGAKALLERFAAGVEPAAALTPAVAVVMALAGAALARAWHPRIAARGKAPRAFRSFELSDHLVWGVIAGLGIVLLDRGPAATTLAWNGLAVLGVLYALQGTAVLWAVVFAPGRRTMVLMAALAAAVLLPVALGAMILVGIADTWLDFRRRPRPPSRGGVR